MTRHARTIGTDDTVRDAAREMKELGVGVLPVGEKLKLVGVITDRDITVRVTAEDRDPATTRVAEVMTPRVVCCHQEQDVFEAAKIMVRHHVRRLVVLDRREEVVGVLSVDDLGVMTREEAPAGEATRTPPSRPGGDP